MARPKKVQEKAELHVHTKESFDGSLTSTKIHMDALRYNIKYVAFTDHDTTAASREWILNHGGDLSMPIHEIDGVKYINGVELSVCFQGITDSNGKPFNFHLKVLGASQAPDSPLEQFLTIKEDNDAFVNYTVLQYLAAQIGVTLDEEYIKDYILERRRDDPKFSRFDGAAAIDFLDTYNLMQGRSERELTRILKNLPRPKRVYIDAKDAIDIAHASGGIVTMAHPAKSLAKLSEADRKMVIEKLLDMGIDGFERIYNAATPEINELIDECQKNHYSVNEYLNDGGSDNHHVCPGNPLGQTYLEDITCDKVETVIKDVEKRQFELENNMNWHRSYPIKTKAQIDHTILFYSSLNSRFKMEFTSRTTPGGIGSGTRN